MSSDAWRVLMRSGRIAVLSSVICLYACFSSGDGNYTPPDSGSDDHVRCAALEGTCLSPSDGCTANTTPVFQCDSETICCVPYTPIDAEPGPDSEGDGPTGDAGKTDGDAGSGTVDSSPDAPPESSFLDSARDAAGGADASE